MRARESETARRVPFSDETVSLQPQTAYLPAICFSCCSIIFLTIYPPTDPFCLEVRSPL